MGSISTDTEEMLVELIQEFLSVLVSQAPRTVHGTQ